MSTADFDFLPYLGLGLGMGFWAGHYYYGHADGRYYHDYYGHGGAALFMRLPILGLGFHWKKVPLDTMLEGSWAPYLALPDLPHGDVAFKLRYYF